MATRNKLTHDQKTREKIQTSQIINRLTEHVLSPKGKMSSSQVNAARVLLNKTLPDLKQFELQGDVEHSGKLEITWQK